MIIDYLHKFKTKITWAEYLAAEAAMVALETIWAEYNPTQEELEEARDLVNPGMVYDPYALAYEPVMGS